MKTIEAFKCEHTGAVFEEKRSAALSEFRALMRGVARSLPAFGSIASDDVIQWLTRAIEGEVYATVPDKLRAALDYFDANIRKSGPSEGAES